MLFFYFRLIDFWKSVSINRIYMFYISHIYIKRSIKFLDCLSFISLMLLELLTFLGFWLFMLFLLIIGFFVLSLSAYFLLGKLPV